MTLVREMRDHGRADFIGLTSTGLVDAEEFATALESLPAPSQGGRSHCDSITFTCPPPPRTIYLHATPTPPARATNHLY